MDTDDPAAVLPPGPTRLSSGFPPVRVPTRADHPGPPGPREARAAPRRGKARPRPHPGIRTARGRPLAGAGSAGPPHSQSRPGGGAAGAAGCSEPLRRDALPARAAQVPRRRQRQQRPAMQEPLLGAEGRDYDTFPEKAPPSPEDRTPIG